MNSPAEDDGTLGTGTRLGEFEIRGLVGIGGFGIVYRAFDHDLEREVAIKEYMPGLLASRTVNGEVQPRSRTHAETFGAGMRSFMLEAKMLARFDHPALVKVFRYWEGNGTAYMVMPLYQGQTLGHALKQMPAPPTESWLMGVLVPLLGALEVLHSQQIFHRDVSPDNILLLRNGRPVLLDFGAARQVISDRTQTLTAILKPNYAPIEQYAEVPSLRQGPWTDLYALGAVVYASLTGKPPPPAAARTIQDDIIPLADIAARLESERGLRYSRAFLDAWQQTLAVRPADRPQNVADLMHRLGLMPTATLGMDDDSTVLVPNGPAPAPTRQDSDWTVVVTGQRFTHHPDAYSKPAAAGVAAPTAPAAPPEPPAAERPVTVTQRTGMNQPTGRDMRMIPPGATLPPAAATAAATTAAATPTAAPTAPVFQPPESAQRTTPGPAPAARPPADPLTPLESPPRKGGGLLIGTVAGALALAAGGYFLLRSTGPVAPAAEPVPVAVSAPAPAVQPPAATPLPAPVASRPVPPMITEYPETPASKAVMNASKPAAAASIPAAASAAITAQPGASAVPKPDKAAQVAAKASAAAAKASAAAAQVAAKASAAAVSRQGATSGTQPASASGTAPASGKSTSSSTASTTADDRPTKAEPRTLDNVCGKRVLLARTLCIQEACQSGEFNHQPACIDIRRKADEENSRQLNAGG